TSTITSQSVPGNVYFGDTTDHQWSPEQNNQITQPEQVQQWQDVRQFDIANGQIHENFNLQPGPEQHTYNVNNQNHFTTPSYELIDLSNQKALNHNMSYYNVPNGTNTNSVFMTAGCPNNMMSQRGGPVYTPINNAWNNSNNAITRPMPVSRTSWITPKTGNGVTKKPKRVRTAFTSQQMMELELEYTRTRYLDRNRRLELSEKLQLNERTIKIWFQNRRMKDKKDRAESNEESEATSTTESSPEMGMPHLYDNYHQNMPYNELNRLNSYMDQNVSLMPVLGNNGVPIPVQNIMANSHSGYYMHGTMPTQVDYNRSGQIPLEDYSKKDIAATSETSKENDDFSEFLIKNEPSPTTTTVEDDSNVGINDGNWDLSWIRIIDSNDEA
ncbi:unnamed protein product, partial [Leptidea sinapis]